MPVIVLTVLGIFVGVMTSLTGDVTVDDDPGSASDTTVLTAAALPPTSSGEAQALIFTQPDHSDRDQHHLTKVRLGSGGPIELWTVPVKQETITMDAFAVGDAIVMVVGRDVTALDTATGKTRWSASLPDDLGACPHCGDVLDDRVILQTIDGRFTAFGADSSEPVWQYELADESGSMAIVGDRVVVVDTVDGHPALVSIDPSNGAEISTVAPTCDGFVSAFGAPPIFAVPDTDEAIAILGNSTPCAVRWDPASGDIRYENMPDGLSAPAYDAPPAVVGANRAWYAAETGVGAIDLATGASVTVDAPSGVKATPEALVNGLLLVRTERERGTPVAGLAGVDVESGTVRWDRELAAHLQWARVDGWPESFSSSADGFALLTVDGEDDRATLTEFRPEGEGAAVTMRSFGAADGDVGSPRRVGVIEDLRYTSLSVISPQEPVLFTLGFKLWWYDPGTTPLDLHSTDD